MIPKIIHYCWFGKGLMPKSQADNIKKWKKLIPDYEIMRWDESNFDIDVCSYTLEAYNAKRYAFVSDVARLEALYKFGGVYLDTDVELFKRLDDYLDVNFFSAIELYNEFYTENISDLLDSKGNPLTNGIDIPHLEIMTSIMGAAPQSFFIKKIFDYYLKLEVDAEFMNNSRKYVIYDRLVARLAVGYGFRYVDEKQILKNNMVIYPTGVFGHAFCPNPNYEVSYHYNAATWSDTLSKSKKREVFFDKLHLLSFYKICKTVKKQLKNRF